MSFNARTLQKFMLITDYKIGQQFYKIEWQPTWEPISNLTNCAPLIHELWEKILNINFDDCKDPSIQKSRTTRYYNVLLLIKLLLSLPFSSATVERGFSFSLLGRILGRLVFHQTWLKERMISRRIAIQIRTVHMNLGLMKYQNLSIFLKKI